MPGLPELGRARRLAGLYTLTHIIIYIERPRCSPPRVRRAPALALALAIRVPLLLLSPRGFRPHSAATL